jgi:predicted SAM-dependent methyltransferase
VLDPRRVRRYLGAHPVRKLQLGTGPNPLAGWLNTDLRPDLYREHRGKIVFLDATKSFPFDDMTFDYVFSEHQIEHISQRDASAMARECFRVLCPGGRIRIATPDLAAILRLYANPLDGRQLHYIEFMMTRFLPDAQYGNPSCHVINLMFKGFGHRFIYDDQTLSALLSEAGFVEIVKFEPGESGDPALRGLEAHGRAIGDEDVNRLETMVIEGTRPAPTGSKRRLEATNR